MDTFFKLLESYSFSTLFVIIVVSCGAFKIIVDFYSWAKEKLKYLHDKNSRSQELEKAVNSKYEENSNRIKQLENDNQQLNQKIDLLCKKIDDLIDSDKDDIKSFITIQHHYFCYQLGWIDDYSLECCERRYNHYVKEGGNSFIGTFMNDLRALSRYKPDKNTKMASRYYNNMNTENNLTNNNSTDNNTTNSDSRV